MPSPRKKSKRAVTPPSKARSRATPASADTKNALLLSAQRHFAANGYKASSVHEIAKDAGVNVSLVSYHFGNKEGLFKACLSNAGSDRLAIAERILHDEPKSIEDMKIRLSLFIDDMLLDRVNNPEICAILQRDLLSEFDLIEDEFRDTFLRLFQLLSEFFERARGKNLLSPWIHARSLSVFLMGSVTQVIRTDHIREKIFGESIINEAYRRQARDQMIQLFFEGITNRPSAADQKGFK
jgi:AcrR family transcriptional regulator